MTDKLTACKDCPHMKYEYDVRSGEHLYRCCAKNEEDFNFFSGEFKESTTRLRLCMDINTDGHCKDFEAKEKQ